MSWWDINWWRTFIVLPLSEKIGYEPTLKLDLVEAFGMRDSISDRNEFEEYAYWFSDMKREQEKDAQKQDDNKMKLLMPAEKNKKVVEQAMQSADSYFGFLQSRGFNGGKSKKK